MHVFHTREGEQNVRDADAVLALAKKHKIAPLVIPVLQRQDLPTDSAEQCRQMKYHIASHALRHFHELCKALAKLSDAGVQAVPFKGMALSWQLYGDYHKRQFVDLDIFIDKANAARAIQVLTEIDFSMPALQKMSVPHFVERFSSIEAFKKNRTVIDLQWDLSNQYALLWDEPDKILDYAEVVEIEGEKVRVFDQELTLYLLGVHGAKNGYCELRYVVDLISFFIRYPNFDYAAFLSKAKKLGIDRFFTVGALLGYELFSTAYPPVFENYASPASRQLAKKIMRSLPQRTDIPVGMRGFIMGCQFKSNVRELGRYILFRMRPTKGDVHHGDGSLFNSYLHRLKKVISNS